MFGKRIFKTLAPLAMGALLIGYASPVFSAVDLNPKLQSGQYVQKANAFEVIFDASESMNEIYKGSPKMVQEKALINLFNDTIPNLKLTAAERAFGNFSYLRGEATSKLLFGPTNYDKSLLPKAQAPFSRGKGFSPLDAALDGATADFKSQDGRLAVVVFSNGEDMQMFDPVAAAKRMKQAYGDRVCIYTVVLGDKADTFDIGDMNEGVNVMKKVADAGECGLMVKGADISSPAGMADFVEKIFLAKDSDCDGVADDRDKCPDTPKGCAAGVKTCPVDQDGCPLDSDGDGVIDCMDKCPGTAMGAKVDADGCPMTMEERREAVAAPAPAPMVEPKAEEPVIMTLNILFATGKSNIQPKYQGEVKKVADYLKAHPEENAVIAGHTDNVGAAAANKKLSQARANSVKNSLVKNYGIDESRLEAVGYGEEKPVASNKTKAGKQKNRRVTVIFTNQTK